MGIENNPKFNPPEDKKPLEKENDESQVKKGGIIDFFKKRKQIKEQEKIKLREMFWGDYDSPLWHIGLSFVESLPEKYRHLGSEDGFRSYIENTLSQEGAFKMNENKLTAVEFGGSGSELFRGFSNCFFKKTLGVCLADIRGENLKKEDTSLNHYVIAKDMLDFPNNKLLSDIKTVLDTSKVDLIISRMRGGLNEVDIKLFENAVKEWFKLLNENGIMFIQYKNGRSPDNEEDIITAKNIERIKEIYPNIDIQLGPGVMRLHKNFDSPEQLSENEHLFVE